MAQTIAGQSLSSWTYHIFLLGEGGGEESIKDRKEGSSEQRWSNSCDGWLERFIPAGENIAYPACSLEHLVDLRACHTACWPTTDV